MTNERKIDPLTHVELKDVKGGIPYEQPNLLMLTETLTSCTVGKHCDNGHNGDCSTGLVCSSGTHGIELPPPK